MILSDKDGPRKEYRLVEIRVFPSADAATTYPVEVVVSGWCSFPAGALRLDAAIAHKREFETQISPSLRRSKELLEQISAGIGVVQAV